MNDTAHPLAILRDSGLIDRFLAAHPQGWINAEWQELLSQAQNLSSAITEADLGAEVEARHAELQVAAPDEADADGVEVEAAPVEAAPEEAPAPAPRRRGRKPKAAAPAVEDAVAVPVAEAASAPAPKRRGRKPKAAAAEPAVAVEPEAVVEPAAVGSPAVAEELAAAPAAPEAVELPEATGAGADLPLAQAVAARAQLLNLPLARLAKAIGVAPAAVTRILDGSSRPNAATLPRYARFLGLALERVQAMTGRGAKETAAPAPAAKRRGRQPKAAAADPAPKRRGRPAKAAVAAVPAPKRQAPSRAARALAKAGRPRGRQARRPFGALIALAADALAQRVHAADPALRLRLAALLVDG